VAEVAAAPVAVVAVPEEGSSGADSASVNCSYAQSHWNDGQNPHLVCMVVVAAVRQDYCPPPEDIHRTR